MKKWMRASIAMLLALVLLGSFAFAEGRVVSDPFRLPEVKVPQAEQPAEEQPSEEQPSEEQPSEEQPSGEQPAEEQPEQSGPAAVIGSAVVALENEGSSLNVRAAASADSERVGSLAHGEAVSVLGYSGDWTHIRTSAGTEGYVLSSYLTDSIAETPAEETPAEETPAEETPAEELPAEELPTEELPAEETPAEELPAEELPAEELPAEELPAEELPAEELPAEELPAEELPAEETPAEELPAEELPAGETPAPEATATAKGDADLRIAADGLSEIIYTIPDGTPLVVLGVEGDWVQVSVNDLVGYVYIDSVDGVQPSQPEVEDPAPEMKVTIFSSRRSEMALGETVYLTSRIEGFENYEIMYQWECDRGNGFEIISGANTDSFAFEASVETLAYAWRLSVYYR